MKVRVYTLGCRLNQTEGESIADAFESSGFVLTSSDDADLAIVDTCTVTGKAEQKARRIIRHFSSKIPTIVTGCYAQVSATEIESIGNNIRVFKLSEKPSLLLLPEHIKRETDSGKSIGEAVFSFVPASSDPFSFASSDFHYHSRAYLKVQDGCDNGCAFCATTLARGYSRHLESDEVVRRALKIEEEGYREIVLTGVNLSNYDRLGGGLGELIEKLLSALGPGMRIRLSSMESDNIDERVLNALRDPRMQPHFHIPVQSASKKVLRRVSRFDSIDYIRYMVGRMREVKDDPFIACDIIAGLPGEGDEEFEETVEFLIDNDFSSFHVFPFSPRPGTSLYSAKDRVPERVRDERALILRNLSESQKRKYIERNIGKNTEVLAESGETGTTGNYLKARIILPEGRIPIPGAIYSGVFTSIDPLTVTVPRSEL